MKLIHAAGYIWINWWIVLCWLTLYYWHIWVFAQWAEPVKKKVWICSGVLLCQISCHIKPCWNVYFQQIICFSSVVSWSDFLVEMWQPVYVHWHRCRLLCIVAFSLANCLNFFSYHWLPYREHSRWNFMLYSLVLLMWISYSFCNCHFRYLMFCMFDLIFILSGVVSQGYTNFKKV